MRSTFGSMPSTQRSANTRAVLANRLGRLEHVAGHHRDVHVELELARGTGEGDCGVVADDLGGNLGGGLTQHRVDLARHDGASLAADRAGGSRRGRSAGRTHQADIVGDLVQGDRHGAHSAGELHQGIAVGLSLEVILGLTELVRRR